MRGSAQLAKHNKRVHPGKPVHNEAREKNAGKRTVPVIQEMVIQQVPLPAVKKKHLNYLILQF